MKIAIHNDGKLWNKIWEDYCAKNNIPYTLVDCYRNDVIDVLAEYDVLMWHWHHADPKAVLFARQLISSIEMMGKKVYPDSKTCWHFDDKIGQKYLLEAVQAPLVPSYIFYDKREALEWIDQTDFPKVFKLRNGAASYNVRLVRTKNEAENLVKKAFGRGFTAINRRALFKDRIWHLRRDKNLNSLIGLGKGLARLLVPTEFEKFHGREKGYVYFQDFIPGNKWDFRMQVIGNKCWGFRRLVREGDFRASGAGKEDHDYTKIPIELVKKSFEIKKALGLQTVGFDFIMNEKNQFLLVEMSYCFGYEKGDGEVHWDDDLNLVNEKIDGPDLVLENILKGKI